MQVTDDHNRVISKVFAKHWASIGGIIPVAHVNEHDPLPADRLAEDEIEVTDEMIEAGVLALKFRDRPTDIVVAVYEAMRRLDPTRSESRS